MSAEISDLHLKILVATWSEASLTQFNRLKIYFEDARSNSDYQGKFDTIFLLEALHQLCCFWTIAVPRFNIRNESVDCLLRYAATIRDLRNMNVHQLDYLTGDGRNQERFIANTDFQHSATTIQVVSGCLVIGGRFDASASINLVTELDAEVHPRTGSIWR